MKKQNLDLSKMGLAPMTTNEIMEIEGGGWLTLLLGAVGAVVGFLLGGVAGGVVGMVAGAWIGNQISPDSSEGFYTD